MKLSPSIILCLSLLSIFYFSSCENPMADAQAAYENTEAIGDSIAYEMEVIGAQFGTVQGEFQSVLAQAQRRSSLDSTMMQTLQKLGNTLSTQQSVIADAEDQLDDFEAFDPANITPDSIMTQVNIMQGGYSEIKSALARVQEVLLSVSGALENLKERLNNMEEQ